MSFQRSFIKNFVAVGVFKYSSTLVTFIGTVIISRQLSPKEYAVVSVLAIFYGMLAIFIDNGFANSIIREDYSKQETLNIIWFYVILGAALMLILSLASLPIQRFYGIQALYKVCIVYSTLLFLNCVSKPLEFILNKRFQFKFIAIVGLTTNLIQVGLTYVLALLQWSYWALVIPSILSAFTTLIFYSKKTGIKWTMPQRHSIVATVHKSKSLILNVSGYRFLVYSVRNIDNFIVSKIFGLNLLGLYSRAFNMAALPVQIITGVSNDIQFSMLADLKKEGSKRMTDEFAQFLRLLGIIGFPFVLIFQIWSHEFSRMVWGVRWESVGTYLEPLSILIPTNLILYSVSSIFLIERQEKLLFRNSLVSALGIVGGVVIGSFFSLKGLVVGLLLGNLMFTIPITGYNVLYRILNFSWSQILRIWGVNWLIAFGLTVAYIFAQHHLKIAIVVGYGLLFIVRGYNYYRLHLIKQ